jgi:hypothetical protein
MQFTKLQEFEIQIIRPNSRYRKAYSISLLISIIALAEEKELRLSKACNSLL